MAAATALVLVAGSLALAVRGRGAELRVSATPVGTPTPTVESRSAPQAAPTPARFTGTGSWTMSSLPECWVESERERGPFSSLAGHVPPASQRLPPGTVLHVGPCTVTVGRREITIVRGDDRLLVPPDAALFDDGRGDLTLVDVHGTQAEIRRYQTRDSVRS